MKRYKVTAEMSKEEFLAFLDSVDTQVVGVEVFEHFVASTSPARDNPFSRQVQAPGAPRQRKLRGSKVNDTILGKLREGQTHISELKNVMANAGLKPASLSTALSLLKKSGRIKGMGEGMYELAEAA